MNKKCEENSKRTGEMSMILSRIAFVWFNNPQLRLCQLVGNCFDAGDNYHKTDKELLEKLTKQYPLLNGDE